MKSRVPGSIVAVSDLLLLFGAVVLFYPCVGLPGWISPGGDMVNLMLPGREWAARWLAHGVVPLWNPQTFGGVPFVGAMQAAVFYPPNLIAGAFLSPLGTINLLRLAHIYLFGAAAWFFLRAERGLARPAALLGAIALAGSAHVASHTDHINQLAAMAWLPSLVACQWRWWRTGSRGALAVLAAVLALQILAGHPQAVFYSILLSVAIAAAWFIKSFHRAKALRHQDQQTLNHQETKTPRKTLPTDSKIQNPKSKITFLAVAVLGGFFLASIQVIPTLETAHLSRRSADNLEYTLFGSMPPRAIWSAVTPHGFGDPQFSGENNSFIGRTTLLLAILAVGVGVVRRRPYVIFWALIILAAYILALGGYGPFWQPGRPSPIFHAYLWLLPSARHLRVPPRILLLATFGLAALAAEGLDWFLRLRYWTVTAPRRRMALLAAWGAVVVVGIELWAFQRGEFHNRVVRYYPPEVMLSGEARMALAPLLRPDSPQSSLAHFRFFRLLGRDDPDYLMDSRPEAVRNRYVRLQPNLGMMLDVAEIEGYEEGLLPPIRYFDFLNFFNRNLRSTDPDAVLLGLMNVRYLYADYNQPIQSATWRLVGQIVEPMTGRNYRLYENPLWLPRVVWADWLPPEIVLNELRGTFSRNGMLSERMGERHGYGPPLGVIAVRGRLAEPEQLATLRIRLVGPNRIIIENPTQRGGTLLVAQNAYPGWVVEAAGETARLEPATDFSAMAVVPPGATEITIAYRPFSFRLGSYLSGLALAAWLALSISIVTGRSRRAWPTAPVHGDLKRET